MIKIPVRVTSDLDPSLAYVMAESVRRHMDVELIHVAEPGALKLKGFDSIMHIDHKGDYVDMFLQVMSGTEGNVIALDYDIIVQSDLSDVFDMEFDVAFTTRQQDHGFRTMVDGYGIANTYNMGVVFSRSPEFWRECKAIYDIQPRRDGWLNSQTIVSFIVTKLVDKFNVVELPGDIFNYTPKSEHEDVSDRRIVHYKGAKKGWMLPPDQRYLVKGNITKVLDLVDNLSNKSYC